MGITRIEEKVFDVYDTLHSAYYDFSACDDYMGDISLATRETHIALKESPVCVEKAVNLIQRLSHQLKNQMNLYYLDMVSKDINIFNFPRM